MNIPARSRGVVAVCGFLVASGCVSLGPAPVDPSEIPALQERALREPGDGGVKLRLGAALAAGGRCEEAMEAAREGQALAPADPLGPLVIGQCLEDAGNFEGALQVYNQYTESHGDEYGAAAVEGRRVIALQAQARELARAAIAGEEELPPTDSLTVGVFPFLVGGAPEYQPLSVGLAHMLTTDLALLQRFPMVERVALNALLQELELPPELIDPESAVRTGRMMRASRMVLGTLDVRSGGGTQLGGNIVLETGDLVEPSGSDGDIRDLLALEKTFALQMAENLGYQLSEAERQRVLENQPGSLAAFLAFSRGLLEEDLGNFRAAAAHYEEAVRADPQYQEAQERLRGTVGAGALSGLSRGDVPIAPPQIEERLRSLGEPDLMANVLAASVLDLASHQPERATLDAGSASPTIDVVPEETLVLPLLEAVISILIPIGQ